MKIIFYKNKKIKKYFFYDNFKNYFKLFLNNFYKNKRNTKNSMINIKEISNVNIVLILFSKE